jgi:arsenate reductase-like glutaredoxin family protein
MSDAKADKLTLAYIKMRDRRAELLKEYEAEDAKIGEQMQMVEDELRNLFDEVGLESIRTTYGTVYRSVKTQYQVNDWDSMYKFVMEHNVPQLLQRRVSTTNMKQFLDENPNLMPMGMNIDNRYTVTVRRSKS